MSSYLSGNYTNYDGYDAKRMVSAAFEKAAEDVGNVNKKVEALTARVEMLERRLGVDAALTSGPADSHAAELERQKELSRRSR
jgi:hypothetical protein